MIHGLAPWRAVRRRPALAVRRRKQYFDGGVAARGAADAIHDKLPPS
jgi:hypothetical protein